MSKKSWKLIGNGLLGALIVASGIIGLYVFPSEAIRDIMPYAGKMGIAMEALFYAPYVIPIGVALCTVGCYYRFGRSFQDTFISLAILMLLACFFVAPLLYIGARDYFLDNHIVYQGNCRSLGVGVQTEGNRKNLYANFICDNYSSDAFKVWNPDIIAYVANHPDGKPMAYELSAGGTLLPLPHTVADGKK